MKILVASDIHGSELFTKKLLERYKSEQAELLILLGDIYNHGPRNPFPKEYKPNSVASLLNSVKENLIVVKGNCDSQVDTLISEFDFIEDLCIISGGKRMLLTHGHVYNKDSTPSTKFDVVIYGHFHTGFIEEINGVLYVNVGSVSLPKNGTPSSYVILEDGKVTLKDIDGKIIKEK